MDEWPLETRPDGDDLGGAEARTDIHLDQRAGATDTHGIHPGPAPAAVASPRAAEDGNVTGQPDLR